MKDFMPNIVLVVLMTLLIALPGKGHAEDLFKHGLKAGEQVPIEIALTDQSGMKNSLEDIAGPEGVILLFNRSSDWCGYCIQQMIAWNKEVERFNELGYKIAAISYDPVAQQRKFTRTHDINYPVLSDENSRVIKAFNILNESYDKDSPYYGIPHPAIYVINPEGVITHRFAEPGYKARPAIEAVYQSLLTDAPLEPNEDLENAD